MANPFLIGIAGGSGAGKSTVVELICEHFPEQVVTVINQDHYYLDHSDAVHSAMLHVNFDHPDSLDLALMADHAQALLRGESILRPVYDFVSHTRLRDSVRIEPGDIIIFDGIFSLYYQQLRAILDFKIFLDVPADLRLARRLARDLKERGRSCQSVIQQYIATVRPMHNAYVEPTKYFADSVLSWEDASNGVIDSVVDKINSVMAQRIDGGYR